MEQHPMYKVNLSMSLIYSHNMQRVWRGKSKGNQNRQNF